MASRKKKIIKRKIAIKKSMPRKPAKALKQEIILRVEQQQPPTVSALPTTTQLAAPEVDGGKYMIPKTWMSEKQVLRIVQKTPTQYIYKRPAKGGGVWLYVTGSYVEKVLNFTFGWNWDIEVVHEPTTSDIIALIINKIDQIWVTDKLTVKDDKGHTITKSQTGRADIKFRKNTRQPLDIGNDLKAAHTDALKKCASLLGIASDIYGKLGYQEESGQNPTDAPEPPQIPASVLPAQPRAIQTPPQPQKQALKPGQVSGPDGNPVYICQGCEAIISDQVAEYSMRLFKKRLCGACQKA